MTGTPYGIKLERGEKYLELVINPESKQVIEHLFNWRNTLSPILNQRGFHEIFKPIKKIGKGNFASVYLVVRHEDNKKLAVKAFSKEAVYSE